MYRSHHSSATSKLCSYQTVLGLTTLAVRVWCLRSLFNKSKHGSSRSRIQIPLCPPEGVKKFKSPCNPPFSKGEMLKRESASVDRKYLRIPLFRVRVPLFGKLIMRHIFLTEHGEHEVLFCLRDRLWPQFFGTKHCGHSSDDRPRAWNFAGGVVAPDMRETELAQPQR